MAVALGASPATAAEGEGLKWVPWSEQVFAQAKKEQRFVILNLHAVWCHWCHVMEETTYRDPQVIKLLHAKYITVQVDADQRPDLANRYEDYGWPATIVFAPDGSEIVKRRGYLEPEEMSSLLQAIIDDPTPGPSVQPEKKITYAKEATLPAALRTELEAALPEGYDEKESSWGTSQKYLDWDNTEYCLTRALQGDRQAAKMARETLKGQLHLLDPAWGGVYQYSTDGDWVHPHFEKLMQFQSENLRVYALAYALWGETEHLQTAQKIHGYLRDFLTSPEGAFYVSQDADLVAGEHSGEFFALDDAGRRKLGVPRVDKHLYARENGWAIHALVALYRACGDETALQEAQKAAAWIVAHRAAPGGGFRHDEQDSAGPYLGDTLSMGRAFLDLYTATGERAMLQRAEDAAIFIGQRFAGEIKTQAGLISAVPPAGALHAPKPQYDENVMAARFANLLFRYTAKPEYRALAECAMRYLATPDIAQGRFAYTGGILMAANELAAEPLHLTIVGAKADPAARQLFARALQAPTAYKVTEWFDPAEGKLPYQKIEFPELPAAAAFVCANEACSSPLRTVEALAKRLPHEK